MYNKKLLQWGNILTFIATFIINYAATGLELGGYNTGELSDLIPNLFVPIGLTFSIWGVIYFFLAGFSVYQGRDLFKSEEIEMDYLNKIGYYFILSNIANSVWIFLWHYRLVPLSLIAMIVILFSLLMIYLRLGIGKSQAPKKVKIWVHAPFSIYLGWITVATIANVTATLVESGFDAFGFIPEFLTVFVIIVAVLITYGMLLLRKDWVYSLVVLWATLGIYLKQSTLNLTIATTALIAVIIVAVGIIYTGFKLLKK
ncbi:MAG: hypothetical protein EU533_00760 [Promethearchaeota archaeon]|nr:MAG: hypothetical protein EU533_00760 [Candidatus Lokiarchaeota archaeon]